MAQASYSFLDVAALDGVRERFARGEALAILSADLEEVIWANGPGAVLLGHFDVETIFGAQTPLGTTAKRQIAALRGFPDIGRDRPLLVRVTLGVSSDALRFLASAVTMPDGEKAILLAAPLQEGSEAGAAGRAIEGFSQDGHFVAMLNGTGAVEAASPGFERLGLTQAVLAELAADATEEKPIAKRMLAGRRGRLPAGLARLTGERNLIVVIDENWADADEWTEPAQAADVAEERETAEPDREIWYLGSEDTGEADAPAWPPVEAAAEPIAEEAFDTPGGDAVEDAAVTDIAVAGEIPAIESGATNETPINLAPTDEAPTAEPAPAGELIAKTTVAEDGGEAAVTQVKLAVGPLRFVWRTDGEGRFSQLSPEFARAVGVSASDLVGRSFEYVSEALALDPGGEIAGLLARRDTWSGRTVFWPVAGTELRVPVDLAALPVYDRNRNFEGFRGFGVARTGDATRDPARIGLTLPTDGQAETAPAGEAAGADTDLHKPQPDGPESLSKVIQLAAHRQPPVERPVESPAERPAERPAEKSLSTGERIAFQQIAERLRRDTAQQNVTAPGTPDEARSGESAGTNLSRDAKLSGETLPAGDPVADHRGSVEGASTEAERTNDVGDDLADLAALHGVQPPSQDLAVTAEMPKPPRPGLSLLDFAHWDVTEGGETAEDLAFLTAAGFPKTDTDRPATAVAVDGSAAGSGDATDVSAENVTAIAGALTDPQVDPDAVLLEDASEDDGKEFAETDLEPVAPAVEKAIEAAEVNEVDVREAVAEQNGVGSGSGLSILEHLPVPVLVHSGDVLHYANDEFFALTGYASTADFAEAGGIAALFADSHEQAGEDDGEAHRQPDRSIRVRTRDGRELPVEAFLQSIPWNGGKALILVLSRVKDGVVSGQSPLIAELEARVAEMRTIIDTATDGVVLISREGDIRSISRPAEALFGLDSDQVAGHPFSSLFAIESQKSARDYLAGLSDHGVASVLNDGREVIGREAEGRFIPLFMTIGKLPGEGGYCAVMRDITQWKRAEEELTQARATAERSSSHKTDFLARVSHEIRTPLNAIIGFSELMLDEKFGPVANNRYRDYLRDINRSGNHVLDIVNDLLDISKIEAGQQEMAYEAVSLNDALAETVALMQPQANRERVIIRSSFASKLPDVVADLRSVRQIALNVLSNAVRYTQAGGQVIVSTAYENAGDVVLRVRDTGVGMTQAEIEQALKPFKQINSLKRARGDGTGLGLPLTKAMVEANRATFSIHSTPGEGTLVEVSFPSTRVLAE